jgi:hypothetical protein
VLTHRLRQADVLLGGSGERHRQPRVVRRVDHQGQVFVGEVDRKPRLDVTGQQLGRPGDAMTPSAAMRPSWTARSS